MNNKKPLPYVYESTGIVIRFTNGRDPKPRSREVFNFHRPETFVLWQKESKCLRGRLQDVPSLKPNGLRACQITAITNLEASFKQEKPRALVQMATGSGKTFTAITASYRLLKEPVSANRIFWLKDKSLTDLDNLPEPDELAEEIIENLEAGLNSFRKVLNSPRTV